MHIISKISRIDHQAERQVETVMLRFLSSLERQEADSILEFYLDDSIVMFEIGSMLIGKRQIGMYYRGLCAIKPQFSFGQPKIWVQGDLALFMIDWSMTRSANHKESGLRCMVLKRSVSTWKIAIEHPYSHLEWPPNRTLSA